MSALHALRTTGLLLALAIMTMLPGAWTVLNTPTDGMHWLFGNGSAQRIYEKRFERNFPHSKSMAQGWAALKLHLLGEVADGAILGREGVLFTAEEFTKPADTVDLQTELEQTIAHLRPAGIELIPLLIPDKARMMASALRHNRSAPFDTRYDRALASLRSFVPNSPDLRPALSADGSFLTTDTHWSPAGAKQTANTIAALVRSHLDTKEAFVTRELRHDTFVGDLEIFVDTGRWRHITGPTQGTIPRYETLRINAEIDDTGGLFDDVAIPVVLIGTSFSAKPDFHFEGFLKSALQSDVLNLAQIGQGPFAPMRDYLAELDQYNAPPKVILWEIPERYITPF